MVYAVGVVGDCDDDDDDDDRWWDDAGFWVEKASAF